MMRHCLFAWLLAEAFPGCLPDVNRIVKKLQRRLVYAEQYETHLLKAADMLKAGS